MKRNWLEWAALLVSVVAIGAVVVLLVFDGLAGAGRPAEPILMLHADQAREAELGWLLPATASNAGDMAAESVVLEATAEVGGEMETSELEVAFLPPGSEVKVVFGFSAEPSGPIEVRLVSYLTP